MFSKLNSTTVIQGMQIRAGVSIESRFKISSAIDYFVGGNEI